MNQWNPVLIIKSKRIVAIWLIDQEHPSFYHCCLCGYLHKTGKGKFPNECPECKAEMIKGNASRSFRATIIALEKEAQKKKKRRGPTIIQA